MGYEELDKVIFFWIEKTIRRSKQYTAEKMAEAGLDVTTDQWVVLSRVHRSPGISQREIAETTFKDEPTMTRMIDTLVRRELLERRPNEQDRRRYDIHLTVAGVQLMEKLIPVIEDIRSVGVAGITQEELQQAMHVLQKIHANVS